MTRSNVQLIRRYSDPGAGSVDPLLSDLRREHRAEAIPPMAHRLMADVYAAFGEEILDVSKRKWIFYVHKHRDADHFG
jgi:hypothetical protein